MNRMSLDSYRTKVGASSMTMNMRSRVLSASTNFKIGSDDDETVIQKPILRPVSSIENDVPIELFTVDLPAPNFAGTLTSPI